MGKKTVTKEQIQIMYDSTSLRNRVVKSLETESIMVVIWGLREGNGEFYFMSTEIALWKMKNSSRGGWWQKLLQNVNIFNATESYT